MAKPVTPASQPPAPAPGAPPASEATLAPVAPEVVPPTEALASPEPPEASQAPEVPATPETTEAAPAPEAAPTQTYRVNWHFLGFKDQTFNEGDLVEATEEEAAPYLGGVLSLEP